MNYADIIFNDFTAGSGVSVSFFAQGCDKHCPGCHNPETWDFSKGRKFTTETIDTVLKALNANGVLRNLAILGGEPLHSINQEEILQLILSVKNSSPNIPIYLWTGYLLEDLINMNNPIIDNILLNLDFLIDGPYIEEQRNLTLKWRGSNNQRIFDKKEILLYYKRKREIQ